MTGHEYFEDLILRLPDGALAPGETDELREHLRGCADCRRLFGAVEAVTDALGEEIPLPGGLHEGVMARVRAAAPPKKSRAPWRAAAGIAAAFALVLGGLYAARGRLAGGSASAETVEARQAAYEAAEVMPVPAPAAAEPAAGIRAENDGFTDAVPPARMAAASAMEETAEAEETAEDAVPDQGAALAYPLEAPAFVPEGREEEFRALLGTLRMDDTVGVRPIAYVEFHGVIYEFSSDGTNLYWRDAAEGAFPNLSAGTPEDLWSILG